MKPSTELNRLNFHSLTRLGLSVESADIVLDRIGELEEQNDKMRAALEKISVANHCSRTSFHIGECPTCIARAALQGHTPAKPNHHPMSSVDCRP